MTRVIAAFVAASALALGATDDPLKTLRAGHPRLIALDTDMDHIRTLIQQYPLARKIHSDLIKEAEQLMTTPTVEYKLVGPRLLAQSRRCLERVYTLALLYRLHGRKPYLDRAIQELRAAGIRVPADISVTGFDDVYLGAMLTPTLTTVHQPMWLLGERACSLLLERIADPSLPRRVEQLPTKLVIRESCGCGAAGQPT